MSDPLAMKLMNPSQMNMTQMFTTQNRIELLPLDLTHPSYKA